ncbi:MAG: hypothetical protein P1V36_15065, partial [Planctomycetota bacterium]|nr:hypothetical protein [Planctomycetota bacterium]
NPPFSIALDGYVDGPPAFSPYGPHVNFDHHARVDRLSTRSTCMQAFMAVTMGLFDTFQVDGKPHANVYVNDPDQDTCLAVWVLNNPDKCRGLSIHQPVTRLLISEDILDCTGGAYPVDPGSTGMRQQAWVFEPYFEARVAGEIHAMDEAGMGSIIHQVGERIDALLEGKGKRVELDTRYDEMGGGPGWRLIVEHGPHARTALYAAGVRAFVAARDHGAGSWTYTVGKMSPYVRFPIDDLYAAFNQAEDRPAGAGGWGGSNTIGGSPREGGSRIPPLEIERIVNRVLGVDAS